MLPRCFWHWRRVWVLGGDNKIKSIFPNNVKYGGLSQILGSRGRIVVSYVLPGLQSDSHLRDKQMHVTPVNGQQVLYL